LQGCSSCSSFAFISCVIGLDMLLSPRDRGRWLYRERRISRGRAFDLLKFRVLRQQALERADGHFRLLEDDAEIDLGRPAHPQAVVPRRAAPARQHRAR